MSIPYVVRKKADLSSGERKELWYGVPSKMQRRGGVKNKELAVRMAKTTGFHRGQIEGILSELVESIQDLLFIQLFVDFRLFYVVFCLFQFPVCFLHIFR